jgi:putative ABC transport system permease protein
MNYLSELFSQVSGSLLRNKLRTILTMAGIAWGIASMVIIVAMGDSFKEGQLNSMKQLGVNIVILFGGRTEMQAGGQRAGRRIRLNYSDVENIRRECYLVSKVAAELEGNVRATSPYNSGSFDVSGVESFYPELRTIPIADGRFFNEQDEKNASRVLVIGVDVKTQLFGARTDVVGREVAINSMPYQIVGVMANKDQNSSYSGLDEKKIWMPYTTMTRDVPPAKYYVPGYLDEILYQPRSLEQFADARIQVKRVLARTYGFDPADESAVGVWDTVENQKQVAGIFDAMGIFLGSIAGVTLSLGGIGVMNIMLVTVSERTREIGLRKALGATKLRIMGDFLAEGCVLAFMSGLIGFSFAFGLSSLLKLVKMPDEFPGLPVSVTTSLVAFSALTVIAIASSLLPAFRAASLTPVEALRYER